MNKRSISILLPNLVGGGAERVNIDLAHEFVHAGYDVELVLLRARGEFLEEAASYFKIFDLECDRMRQVPSLLARYLRANEPAALFAAMWPMTSLAPMARLLSRYDCPVVISEHNTLSLQYTQWGVSHRAALRASMAVGYRLADACVGVSEGVVQDIAHLSGLGCDRFRVIHNPVPIRSKPSAAALAQAETQWGVPEGRRIVSVGRFKAQKNHALLLRAFAQLKQSDARLMLLGNGGLETELRELAATLGIVDRVIFAGFHPDPTPFYGTADLFVLSSDYEGFGNVIVEALAFGTPVVSTDCPSGPSEILDGGKYGALVPVGNAEALAAAMDEMLTRPHDTDCLRARARDFAPDKAALAYLQSAGLED